MTSIQSSTQIAAFQNLPQTQGSAGSRGPAPTGELPPGLKSDLAEIAESEGLTSEEEASLESDVQDALASLFESSEGRPDPDSVKDVISSVFEEYGLDAEQLADRLGPPQGGPGGGPRAGGPPPGGPPPAAGESDSSEDTDADSTLIETLQNLLENLSDSEDTETVNKISELIVSGLMGVDVEA